jgi:hypothetical protein
MMDDREMRAKIDQRLDEHERRRTSKAARLVTAVGASGKLLAGCIVVEYGAPAYAIAEYAAPFDATADDADFDAGATVEYAAPFDASGIDTGATVDYAAPFDAGDEDVSVVRYGGPMDAG